MELAIDVSRAVNEQAGIARYLRSLLPPLLELTKQRDMTAHLFTTYLRGDREKQAILRGCLGSDATAVRNFPLPGPWKEWLWTTPLSLPDWWYPTSTVLFAPSYLELPLGTRHKTVVTINDLTATLFPEQRGRAVSQRLAARSRAACEKADRIIAISECTKRDLVKHDGLAPGKIAVTPLAADPIFRHRAEIAKEPIILAVGTLEPRKNLVRVIEAYRTLPTKLRRTWRLVLIGGRGWNDAPILESLRGELEGSVEWLGYVDDDELAVWYNRASLFVYPSLYEGFGLPALEAMQSGTAVITSQTSSLPEVVGSAALMVDPTNTKELREAMMGLLVNPRRRHHLEVAGPMRAAQFSWRKTAEQTLKVLLEAAHDTI